MAKIKPQKVSDSQLLSYIQDEISNTQTNTLSELAFQRIESNKAYANDNTIRTEPTTGMSTIPFLFTPSVCDTLVMYMSKIFCSDKETVVYNPTDKSKEAVIAAKQLQQAVNEVLHKKNRGFDIITDLFRTSAVNKNGIAKVVWDEQMDIEEVIHRDIDSEELAVIIQDLELDGYDVSLVEKEEVTQVISNVVVDELTGGEIEEASEQTTGTYTLRLEKMSGGIKIYVIPPEEFCINEDTTDIHDQLTRFVAHSREMYEGDIQAMFPDVDASTLQSIFDLNYDYEKLARHYVDGTLNDYGLQQGQADAVSKIVITESWIRADRDGDGYPEWRHVFSCGNTLLSDEEWFGPLPFASFTFFPIPHKFYGQCVHDRVGPYEVAACGLIRGAMDHTRLSNTFRLFAKDGAIDRRTLQSGKPGVIPVSATFNRDDVLPVPAPPGSPNAIPLMAELRQQVIANVGIDPVSGQVSTDIEKSGNDAAKTSMVIDNASTKLEGYARRFAEGALRDIVWLISTEMVKHSDDPFVMEVIESVSPGLPFLAAEKGTKNVMNKSGITAKVGLGHQTSTQKAQASGVISKMIQQLTADPSEAMYNITKEALKGFNYENPETVIGPLQFWQEKAELAKQTQQQTLQVAKEQQQLAKDQFILEQQKFQLEAQAQQASLQARMQREANESQAKIEEMQSKTALNMAKVESERADIAIKQQSTFETGMVTI